MELIFGCVVVLVFAWGVWNGRQNHKAGIDVGSRLAIEFSLATSILNGASTRELIKAKWKLDDETMALIETRVIALRNAGKVQYASL